MDGLIYLTVSPLYYSPRGAHIAEIGDWEHLDPKSDFYLSNNEGQGGGFLNRMRYRDVLAAIGSHPVEIRANELHFKEAPFPDFLEKSSEPELNLRTSGFRLLLQKVRHFAIE